MNKILTLIFITSIFSANLEVDGGLKVNGPIESQTIDSLLTIISQLESQLALMQNSDNKLETRIYQKDFSWFNNVEPKDFDLFELTGLNIESAIIHYFAIKNVNVSSNSDKLEIAMHLADELNTNYKLAYVRTDNDVLADSHVSYGTFDNNFIYSNHLDYIQTINDGVGEPGSVTLVYAVTALFPTN